MAIKKKSESIDVVEFNTGKVEFCVLGKTPIILHRMSEKSKRELLLPRGRMSAAQKARNVKHHPIQEFQAAPYLDQNPDAPAHINHLSTAFKAAIRGAGVDVPGATKAQLGRLLWVEGERIPIYGTPKLFMSITRSSDMNRTPDVRTRAIIEHWAAKITVSFIQPMLNVTTISNLLGAAGLTQGIGDWRPEKGSGNYGQFELVEESNAQFQEICEIGYDQQKEAMENPIPYDAESEELLEWFDSEIEERGITLQVVK